MVVPSCSFYFDTDEYLDLVFNEEESKVKITGD